MWHDLTDAGWRWRALRRQALLVLPLALALAVLPGPAFVHAALPLLLLGGSLFTAAAYADVLRDARLRQHGLEPPPGDRP